MSLFQFVCVFVAVILGITGIIWLFTVTSRIPKQQQSGTTIESTESVELLLRRVTELENRCWKLSRVLYIGGIGMFVFTILFIRYGGIVGMNATVDELRVRKITFADPLFPGFSEKENSVVFDGKDAIRSQLR